MHKVIEVLIKSLEGGNFGLPITQSNVLYDAGEHLDDDGGYLPFIEVVKIKGDARPHTLNGKVDRIGNGVFTFNLRYAANTNADMAQSKAGEIVEYYLKNGRFEYDGQSVTITDVAWTSGDPDFGWYKLELTIRFTAFTRRV